MLQTWKTSILKQLSMQHNDPMIFIRTQWQRSEEVNPYYVVFRWCVALFFLITWLLSVIEIETLGAPIEYRIKWLIYLTNWGYTFCTAEALLSAVMGTASLLTKSERPVRILYKPYWALTSIATDMAFIITIIYWSFLYNGSVGVSGMNLMVHGFNSIMTFLDLWIVAQPVRILHFYWPILCGVLYVVFTLVYYFAGGTSREGTHFIYFIVDWDKPASSSLVVVGVFFMVIAMHAITYGVFRMRRALYGCLFGKKNQVELHNVVANKSEEIGYVNNAMSVDSASVL